MMAWPMGDNDSFDDIPEYDGLVDLLSLDSKSGKTESELLLPQEYLEMPEEKINWQEQVHMIHLRSHLNKLLETLRHAQYIADKTREELKKCRHQIEQYKDEIDNLQSEIKVYENEGNKAAVPRLQSALKRVSNELEAEKKLEIEIKDQLEQAEYELALAEVERGKFILVEDNLLQRERQLNNEKAEMAMIRLHKEQLLAKTVITSRKKDKRKMQDALNDAERKHIHAIEEVERSHERANKYLSKTLAKLKQRQQEEQDRYNTEMSKKMDMLLKLKKDIANNRENLRVISTRDKAREKQNKLTEKQEINSLLTEGGNAMEILLMKKRQNEQEKKKQEFEAEQKVKKAIIVQKLLKEEEDFKKRKEQHAYLWADPEKEKTLRVGPIERKPPKALLDYIAANEGENREKITDEEKEEIELEQIGKDEESDQEEDEEDLQESPEALSDFDVTKIEEDVNLAKPEFEGLWDKDITSYKTYKDSHSLSAKPVGASKMEKEIFQKTLDKTREGIVITQVAAGKEFTGCPFYSKPKVIHFKDFAVGKSYKKNVILTNVSYTVNYIRFKDITDNLKDFIKISFEPPGQMSAGMACEMIVTFKPLINEDLNGEICFLTQTGPFSISLICSTKKYDLSLSKRKIDFGTSVIGETLQQSFVLANHGALGTKFLFYKVTGFEQRAPSAEIPQHEQITGSRIAHHDIDHPSRMSAHVYDENKSVEGLEKMNSQFIVNQVITEQDGEVLKAMSEVSGQELDRGSENDAEVIHFKTLSTPSATPILNEEDDISALDGLKVGQLTRGNIDPFSSVHLEIIWQPTIPGEVNSEFFISFSDPKIEPLSVWVVANAIDVPVWMERQTVDLKICIFDRLYQDTVIINNRASVAQKLKFEVCRELRNHLEVLPKTGHIQARSQFSAQLKFLPRQSLFKDAAKFFDIETGVLEVPMIVHVGGQVTPVCFTVEAVVTTSDLEFDLREIDFGFCTIHESVRQTLKLTNKSILSQQYGFVGLPECLEVQPNDGFGILLPLETIELDVIFSPKAAKDYKMNLLVKNLISRDFSIPCKGVGVLPPLELSEQVIQFHATSLFDSSSTVVYVINNHTSTNEFSHPVPRIGTGEVCPVGPTSFEFKVPEDAPITISPCVATVLPGQKVRVEVRLAPTLSKDDIEIEALKIQLRLEEEREEKEREEAARLEKQLELESANIGKKKSVAASKKSLVVASKSKMSSVQSKITLDESQSAKLESNGLSSDSQLYRAALASLIWHYKNNFTSVTVPCYVASGTAGIPGELEYSIHNTLYLEVHCPVIRPNIVVISDEGRRTLDFGNVSAGQTCSKWVTIMNISEQDIKLNATALNPTGPFEIRNALRVISPGGTHTLLVTFKPNHDSIFQENLGIKELQHLTTLHLTLRGCGIKPQVNLSVEDGLFDMKAVLVGEFIEKTFMIENLSSLSINYTLKQDSLSPFRHGNAQMLPPFIEPLQSHKIKNYVGPQNKSGRCVFDFVPATGSIESGESREIMVTFAPDHESDLFSDGIRIDLFGQESHFFQVIGQGKSQILYLEGCDPLEPPLKSLAHISKPQSEESTGTNVTSQAALITLKSVMKEDAFEACERSIFIGCVQTTSPNVKKSGDFTVDGIQSLLQKGFTVQPLKGSVEADTKAVVVITWLPPSNFDPSTIVQETFTLTLKGDVTEQIPITIRAMITSE